MSTPVWLIDKWKEMNNSGNFPKQNKAGSLIVVGCNYHTTWQSNSKMRFVLTAVKDSKARLQTRTSRKDFWTNIDDLIFIESGYNKNKAKELRKWEKYSQ